MKNKHMAVGWHLLKFMVDMQKSSFIRDALEALRSRWQWDRPASGSRSADLDRGGATGILGIVQVRDIIFQRFGLDFAALIHWPCCPVRCLCTHYVLAVGT